jgi:hypothetical protein
MSAGALTFEQLSALLRAHDPHLAPSIFDVLKQFDASEQYRKLLDLLHREAQGNSDKAQALRAALEAPVGEEPVSAPESVAEVAASSVRELVEAERAPQQEPQPEPASTKRPATPDEQDRRIVSWLFKLLDDVGPYLPPELMMAYLQCWRLADWKTGEFYISHERLAERLGSANRSSGKRAMRTLRAAGLVRIKVKGRNHRATLYRLAPREVFDKQRVIAAVVSTWQGKNPRMLRQAQADETGSGETL